MLKVVICFLYDVGGSGVSGGVGVGYVLVWITSVVQLFRYVVHTFQPTHLFVCMSHHH